jgi:hypothetical protein
MLSIKSNKRWLVRWCGRAEGERVLSTLVAIREGNDLTVVDVVGRPQNAYEGLAVEGHGEIVGLRQFLNDDSTTVFGDDLVHASADLRLALKEHRKRTTQIRLNGFHPT